MRIKELIKSLGKFHCPNLANFKVCGISCNSKAVKKDFIFVAIKGNRADGNKFIAEAISKGARAVIVQEPRNQEFGKSKKVFFISVQDARRALAKLSAEFYGNPAKKIKVVGITGTNGKTTVSYLIEAMLEKAKCYPAVIGTINYRFRDKVIPARNTTPGPIETQVLLSDMLKKGIDYCIMEVSSHALDQERTMGINFHSAIFTNLTQDHLDYHKTLENYFQSKAKLFKNLDADSFAVINDDDRYGRRLERLIKARVVTYGIENNARLLAKDIRFDCRHTEFKLVSPQGEIKFRSRLIGRHNVYNILAAVSWGIEEAIDLSLIKSAIEGFHLVPGRLERVDSNGGFSVFVDYAHTEDALSNILKALRGISRKRIIVVFGCGGERDKTKRPKMGRVVSELADYGIITNDNPRSEDPRKIIADIKRGINKKNCCIVPERFEAIKKSLSLAEPGDIVLVAGKGHEDYQIIKDKRIHFSDREAIKECLQSMNY